MANRIIDYLAPYNIRVIDNLDAPILTATVQGSTGTTRYIYAATIKTIVGETLPSEAVTVSDGNATLTGFNKVWLQISDIPETATAIRYWKNLWSYITTDIRANSTAYTEGDYVVLAANSDVRYECTTAGSTASSVPTFDDTIGNTTTDGDVTWTCRTNILDDWQLLGEVATDPGQIYDTGQTPTSAVIPTTNTSGRPDVIAIGAKPATLVQRQNWEDLQGIFFRMIQDLGDVTHRDGDIIEGCSEINTSGNTWSFTSGRVYLMGRMVTIPEGSVTLTAVGEEKVGVTITPYYSTSNDDTVQRASADEGVLPQYSNAGPDWLYFRFAWVKDTDGMLVIKEFIDGVPKTATLDPERTVLERTFARKINAVSGSFVVENFPARIVDHESDDTKLTLLLDGGYAFPNGFEIRTIGTRSLHFDKARTTKAVNNSGVDVFAYDGAINDWNYWTPDTVYDVGDIVVPTILNGYRMEVTAKAGDFESGSTEPTWSETPGATIVDNDIEWTVLDNDYDLNGLDIDITVGSGNTHTVTFAADDMTAAQVVSAIEAEINAYPSAGSDDLVNGTAAECILQLQAADGKALTLGGTALTQLGWVSGTTEAEGTRIYQINDAFVKTVTDMNYKIESVVTVTHNGTTHKDLLGESVVSILGASTTLADCHDGKWDYVLTTDFIKDGNYISFDGVGGGEPGSGSTYYVKCQLNYNATKGSRHLVRVTDAKVVKSGEDLPDNLTFTDATSIVRVNGGTVVSPTGTPKDVVNILRINNSPGQSTDQYTAYSLVKNSGALTHETSYIDWSEAGTPGTTGEGQPINSATYYVTYEFWHHAVEGDFVCADSYDDYAEIELAPNDDWYLRDCIDFRTVAGQLPIDGEDPTFDYEFYLARVDKVTLDDLGNFRLLSGAPAVNPPTPPDQNSTLTLGVLRIRPYTYSKDDCSYVSTEPLRITQKGIQRLQERIERLEYWQALNDLESEVAGKVPEGADAQGIFTDALTGFGRMDLQFNRNGVSHTAALDRFERCILLPATQDRRLLTVDLPNSTHVRRAGNSIMLDYLPEVIINQDKAGIWVNGASDFVYDNYYGHMQISPETCVWLDEEQLPQVNIDYDDQFNELINALNPVLANNVNWGSWGVSSVTRGPDFSTEWNNFNQFSFSQVSRAITTTETRTGVESQLVPGAMMYETVGGLVDLSLQGFMRTKNEDGSDFEISLDIKGLMPNVDHACTINGIPVDLTYDSSPVNAAGAIGTHTYLGKTTAKTANVDEDTGEGSLTAKIKMPEGVLAGNATIKVFYYDDPDISVTYANFYSAGLRLQKQDTVIGLPTLSTQNTIVSDQRSSTVVELAFVEPLAQTFTLTDFTYISAVNLYFQSKHATLGYRVEIRNTVNGYPGPEIYASKHLTSDEISVSSDSSVATTFTFDNVLGYRANTEFCFVGIPDQSNTGYELWCSELGTIDALTGERITTQHSNGGVLFHSPNNTVWDPWTKRDLKFQILKSNFENDCQIVFDNLTGVEASRLVVLYDEFVGPATNRRWSYSLDNGATWESFNPRIETDLDDIIGNIKLRIDVTSDQSSYEIVDQYVGIVLLYHDAEAYYVGRDEIWTDALLYPNTINASAYIDADSINVGSGTLATCMATVDDGLTYFVIPQKEGFTPYAADDPYYVYDFQTPDEATITDATNASPIVVTSAGHGFTDNMVVVVSNVEGNTNANGDWVVTNATDDTFELYTTAGVASSGNSAYTSGGKINLKEFSQMRGIFKLSTDNRARTPRVKKISFTASQVA